MIQRTVQVCNNLGLHARAAAKLVRLASGFKSEIVLERADSRAQADGKSILGVLALAASSGTCLHLSIHGEDEAQATIAIEQLFEEGFGEAQ